MSAQFGVNYAIFAEAARPISVASVTPLAIIGTATGMSTGLHVFGSVTAAKEALAGKAGSLLGAVNAVFNQAVETPVILSVSPDSAIANVIRATEMLTKAEAETAFRPNIIIAPSLSQNLPVAACMEAMAKKMKATAIVDIDAESETEALGRSEEVPKSKNIIACFPAVMAWDEATSSTVATPLSSYVAAMICRTDAEREYGFSDSYSNRVISGITGMSMPIEFQLGEGCTADRLRAAGVTTVIRYDGFRLWGGETREADPIWQNLARVRTFDRIAEACQQGVFFAVDRKASQLYYAKRSVEELCRNLTGSQVLIGYDVKWNAEKNTAATVTQGKFYLDVKMQNNPIVKTIELNFVYVDSYSDKLLADINN